MPVPNRIQESLRLGRNNILYCLGEYGLGEYIGHAISGPRRAGCFNLYFRERFFSADRGGETVHVSIDP